MKTLTLSRRNKKVNDDLVHCKGGPMEDKVGDRAKRARQTEQIRRVIQNELLFCSK